MPAHLVGDSTDLKIFGEGEWLAQKHKTSGGVFPWSYSSARAASGAGSDYAG